MPSTYVSVLLLQSTDIDKQTCYSLVSLERMSTLETIPHLLVGKRNFGLKMPFPAASPFGGKQAFVQKKKVPHTHKMNCRIKFQTHTLPGENSQKEQHIQVNSFSSPTIHPPIFFKIRVKNSPAPQRFLTQRLYVSLKAKYNCIFSTFDLFPPMQQKENFQPPPSPFQPHSETHKRYQIQKHPFFHEKRKALRLFWAKTSQLTAHSSRLGYQKRKRESA